ncbi:MAG: Hsp20/alpha crystallin family protein [bacterium]|jgi:HSP20 family molecular chaperone IbpA|nr:Hsp20/alpha crystallin family protein [Chitinophagaceae bacterium]
MLPEDALNPEAERYPGGYVPSPLPPAAAAAGEPASLGERHPVNLSEWEDRFVLEMSVPGACASDFFVRVDGKGLLIGRVPVTDKAPCATRLCRHEFDTNPFRRYIPLPEGVDPERISAAYTNGILRLQMPKGMAGRDCGVLEVPVY